MVDSSVLTLRFGEIEEEKEKNDQTRISDMKAPPKKRTTSEKQKIGLVLAPAYFAIGDDGDTISI